MRAAAGSEAARTNRTLHDRWATTPLAQLRQELPAAQWTEPRVREVCEADYATNFGERDPGTLTCVTDYGRQAGFDGELPDVLRAVDAATRKLGWSDRDQRLVTALAYYETTHRGDAATVPAVTYLVPEPASGTTDCGGPSSLSVSSVERAAGRDHGARAAARPPVRADLRHGQPVPAPRRMTHCR
ncbi:hypothetical protein [Amycolatopsis kentuckyensis]|uniref:hypothetical protein n=1 Tax=Amycolatopsis kentuckyensis TaxID=218823 RepID=UPI0035616F5D